MALPPFNHFLRPTLCAFADGASARVATKRDAVARALRLTEDQQQQKRPGGNLPQYIERINVACTYLRTYGALESEARGIYKITDFGRRLCDRYQEFFTLRQLKDAWRQFREGDPAAAEGAVDVESDPEADENEKTPLEIIDNESKRWRELLATDLLDVVRKVTPEFFERLVLEVLVAMGYGGSVEEAARAVGRAGDEGIDGVIKEDKLGLDVVYVQAKRWGDRMVSVGDVRDFSGALDAARARKGVFITTSRFTQDAREYVQKIEKKIVLIDGRQLAELMIDHDVGVTVVQTYKLKRVDSDYFESE